MRQDRKLWHFLTCDSIWIGSSVTFMPPRIPPETEVAVAVVLETAGRTAAVLEEMMRGAVADTTVVPASLPAFGSPEEL